MKLFNNIKKNQKGFTLIELLVVIGILAILLAITLIAINPARQFQKANDTQRHSDVSAILNAINQYMADNSGQVPASITTTAATIATDDGAAPAEADLCTDLVPTYIADLPLDPTDGTENPDGSVCTDAGATYNTGYQVVRTAEGRITVTAPGTELETTDISVTR